MPSAAVGGSPSATDCEDFAVCLLGLCRVLGAHGELANSGSGSFHRVDSTLDTGRPVYVSMVGRTRGAAMGNQRVHNRARPTGRQPAHGMFPGISASAVDVDRRSRTKK